MNTWDIKIGDEVTCLIGEFQGSRGTVCAVDDEDQTALIEFPSGRTWLFVYKLKLCGQQTAAEINIAFDDFLSAMEEDGDEIL